jgi:phage shock protein PspC (stress-responsive transcriptional regulator)
MGENAQVEQDPSMNTSAQTSSSTNLPAPEQRLRRSVNGSIGGVAQGLANFFKVEVKWVRLAFLLSFLFGGVGLLAYIALWAGLPDELDPRPAKFAVTQNLTRLVVAGIFGVFAFGAMSGAAGISASLLLPAILVGGGIYILSQDKDSEPAVGGQHPKAEASAAETATVSPPPPPATEVSDDRDPLLIEAERLMTGEAFTDRSGSDAFAPDPGHWAMTRTEQAAVTTRRKRPPIVAFSLGSTALICALLLVTGAGVPFFVYPFILLGFALFGFFASLFFRRPAWALIPIAFLSFGLAMSTLFATEVFQDGVGQRTFEIDNFAITGSDLVYNLGAGNLALDLDDVELTEDQTVSTRLVAGLLELDLPDNYRTELVLVDGGDVTFGDRVNRDFQDGDTLVFNGDADGPTLTIEADLKVGEIELDMDSDDYALSN